MQSVLNALRVLEGVAARQPIGVSELARELGLPKSSVQRALRTLHAAGWLHQAGTELTRWALTTKALHVAHHVGGDLSLRDVAVPVMEELREETGETVHLEVREGRHAVLIERLETPKPVRIVLPLGVGAPLHGSSNGKAILAHCPPEEIEQIIAEGLPRYTDATIVDAGALRAELADIRRRGYATNRGEWRTDVAAVAAAILDGEGHAVASMSISTPIDRMPDDVRPRYGALVREAVGRVSEGLGHTG
ncbi:MAG: IclR family transcriptional regulator [Streptosporangiales bacterium]